MLKEQQQLSLCVFCGSKNLSLFHLHLPKPAKKPALKPGGFSELCMNNLHDSQEALTSSDYPASATGCNFLNDSCRTEASFKKGQFFTGEKHADFECV